MANQPNQLITIIIAVYNGVETLQQCIDSVARQSYPNKELIVIDGGSKDGTVDLLAANQEKIAYWVSEPDRGIYNAWNKGLVRARGEWICFLGADDFLWDEQVLERMAVQMEKVASDIRVVYGKVMLLNEAGGSLYPVGEEWEKVKESFKEVMCLPHQGVMHRRSLFELRGNFDESFRVTGDYELLLRELMEADALFVPDIVVTGMRQGGISSNPSNSVGMMREIRRAQRMHGQNMPSIYWLIAMSRVYLRLILWKVLGEKLAKRALDLGRRAMGLPAYWTKI